MSRAMKDSGIPWIGEIPKEWKTEKFKHVFRIKKVLAGKLGYDVLSVTQKGLRVKDITSNEGQVASDYTNYQRVHPNDFVMNHMDLITGYVDVAKQEGVTSPDYRTFYSINADSTNNQYYLYIFQFCYKTRLFYNLGQGVSQFGRWRLPAEQQNEFVIPVPSFSEQLRIAEFLDRKCGEIDEAIALQEEFIEELKSYKQSVITEAVTRGLNPNVKFKDSGIDWIGKIPQGWEISRLKQLTSKIGSGSTPTGGASVYVSEGVKFIRSQNVYNYGFVLDDIAYITEQINNQMKGTQVAVGDILFNITGGSIGRCYIVDETLGKANVNQHVSIVRPSLIYGKYLMYYLQSKAGQEQVSILQTGGNREGLSASAFGEFWVIVPTPTEQQQIADYLDNKCTEIDNLIAIKQQKIEELKDYKESVIYEYVTGKKEVNV